MRYLACLLVIAPLCLRGAAVPHSHPGAGSAERAEHDARPHIHFAQAAHEHATEHDEHHTGPSDHGPAGWHPEDCCQHDHDAFYVSVDFPSGADNAAARVATVQLAIPLALVDQACGSSAWRPLAPPRYGGSRVPVFLASTRLVI